MTIPMPSPPSAAPVASSPAPGGPRGTSLGGALVGLTLLIGAALVATTWFGHLAVREATAALVRGQADGHMTTLRNALREEQERPPSAATLARVLAEEGLTEAVPYVVALDPQGGRWAEAGESLLGAERLRATLARADAGDLLVEGERAAYVGRLAPSRAQRVLHPDRLVPREELTRIAIEVRPTAARRLALAAGRTLAVGVLATLVLLATTFAFARLLRHREALERALAERRQLAALGEMSAVLAHELRNPLASLKGHAQLLAEALPADGRERKKVDRIVAEAERLQALCTSLLDFARPGDVRRAPEPLAPLLAACVEAVPGARVELDLAGAPEAWPLDRLRVEQAVTNLLRNAAEASPEGEAIALAARVEPGPGGRGPGALALAVRDRGPGLPPGQEARVFEPFFTTRVRGTGLGLAVVRRVAEQHGGEVSARTLPGGGAEVVLRLPAGAASGGATGAGAEPGAGVAPGAGEEAGAWRGS